MINQSLATIEQPVPLPGLVMVLAGRCRLLWDGIASYWDRESKQRPLYAIHDLQELPQNLPENTPVVLLQEISQDTLASGLAGHAGSAFHLPVRVVGILMDHSERMLLDAIEAGLWSYASVMDSGKELLEVIRATAQGHRVVSPALTNQLQFDADAQQYRLCNQGVLQQLTKRQREIMGKLAAGESVKQVARDMHLSSKTVESHKYRIMQKLGLHDRVQITRLAIREGLLTP